MGLGLVWGLELTWCYECVKCWMLRAEMGELISRYSSSNVTCANSGPGRLGVLEVTQTDGLGFSLCAAPLNIIGSCISEYMESEPRRGV